MIGLAVSRPCLHSRKAKDIMNAGMRCCTSGCHTFQHECKRQRFADVTKQYIMNQACIMYQKMQSVTNSTSSPACSFAFNSIQQPHVVLLECVTCLGKRPASSTPHCVAPTLWAALLWAAILVHVTYRTGLATHTKLGPLKHTDTEVRHDLQAYIAMVALDFQG